MRVVYLRFADVVEQTEQQLPGKIAAYKDMQTKGAGNDEIYRQALADGLNNIQILKVLRAVFEIPLDEAKQIVDNHTIDQPDING